MAKTRKAVRKAPTLHAAETELGRIEYVSNQPWIVERTGKTRRWNKASGYFTHDNGGRPFYVKIRNGKLCVYKVRYEDDHSIYDNCVYNISSYEKVWIGENSGKYANKFEGAEKGNSLLVRIHGNKYVYIGDHIFEFTAPEPLHMFHGIIGNSDVVYAFAVSKKNYYLFAEHKILPISIVGNKDPYEFYYNNPSGATPLKGSVIVKRLS